MPNDVLTQLGLTAGQIHRLPSNARNRLLRFLLRWEHLPALHACLDALIPANPSLVSLLDLRAQAFLAQGRPDDALATMEQRLQLRTSLTPRALMARIHLARCDIEAAHQIATALVGEHQDSTTAWQLLAEVELARGEVEGAQDAQRHLRELRPDGRAYLLGAVDLYQARQDWVTASGYAIRLLQTADAESPLSVSYLRHLLVYFQASGEVTRAGEVAAELERRRAAEVEAMRAALSGAGPARRSPTPRAAVPATPVQRPSSPGAKVLPTFEQVPVSDEERAQIQKAAGRLFGFDVLLPGQLQTIACALRGEDALTILPTGGGKSLCYQLPAFVAQRGTTLVISPLIALMKDQVDSLPENVRTLATTVNSSLEGSDLQRRLRLAATGAYRLVYAAPERLRQPPFLHAMRRGGLNRLVIDEAHCVSVWGHDFRPDYLTIDQARHALGDPPLLALTATAPPGVRRDILGHLGDMRVIAGDVTRPNLRLEVLHARNLDEKLRYLLAFCLANPGSGIVYADTRARCEKLAALLRRHGVSAAHYHAGIADRAAVQEAFMGGQVRVIVATVAFGMGIDKPDIRFIVHFAPPPSVAAYYQEAGRAGRDGLPARCLLMYAPSDRGILTRRARHDVMSIEFLRAVYGAVQRRLNGASSGHVAAGDLERDLQVDDTRLRVALSVLEETGLLRRGPDLPRAANVCLRSDAPIDDASSLGDFVRAGQLRTDQFLTLDLAAVGRQAGLPLAEIEHRVLAWADAGWLDYRPAGRDLLLELLPPPQDAAERIAALLERYDAIQAQRVDDIASYARTRHCRHGHLNAYLGGRTIARCAACDNCVETSPPPDPGLPDERQQLQIVLRCASAGSWSWGRVTLSRILSGDRTVRPGAKMLRQEASAQPEFGALAFRSRGAIEDMLDRLAGSGYLCARRLDSGGAVLDVTPKGQSALRDPARLDELLRPVVPTRPPPKPAPTEDSEPEQEVDEVLFQRLRAWRLEQARAQKVPPYVVFQDSHLRAIAAQRPLTPEALASIKGVGPRKLEKYGAEVIALVCGHLEGKE